MNVKSKILIGNMLVISKR